MKKTRGRGWGLLQDRAGQCVQEHVTLRLKPAQSEQTHNSPFSLYVTVLLRISCKSVS